MSFEKDKDLIISMLKMFAGSEEKSEKDNDHEYAFNEKNIQLKFRCGNVYLTIKCPSEISKLEHLVLFALDDDGELNVGKFDNKQKEWLEDVIGFTEDLTKISLI